MSLIFMDSPELLNHFGIASLRLLKLLNFGQVQNYFRVIDFRKRSTSEFSLNQAYFVTFYMLLFCHFIACIWLITGRIDLDPMVENDLGWWKSQALFKELNASLFEIWLEGMYFSVSTLTGGAMGNIIPLTNWEFFVDTLINLMGRCA
jgi:hypothetical protein